MTNEEKKAKVLKSIEARGWFTADLYLNIATELKNDGLIKLEFRYFTGGNRKPVWVAA